MKQKVNDAIVGLFYALIIVSGIVQVIFVVLKLSGVIDWNWLYVFLPYMIFACIVILIPLVSKIVESKSNQKHL